MSAEPTDTETGLRLASAYREAGRTGDAATLVSSLSEVDAGDPGLIAMRGLLAEDTGDYEEARAAYEELLTAEESGSLRDEIERRLDIVRTEELRADVLDALAREAEVAQDDPDPATVGIFPFVYEGNDLSWEPLELALPELLATDLAVTGRLQVLERVKIQTLLTELALTESGRVDEATAARSGRLLGSGHIVQGRFRIESGRLGVDAAVVEVNEPGAEQVDPLTVEDAVDRLFELEKRLALDLHAELGVQLTPAERERVTERQTESVEAILEFGLGLAAENNGDFGLAEQHYSEASSHDPRFRLAQDRRRFVARFRGFDTVDAARRFSADARRLALRRDAVRRLRTAPASIRQRVLQDLGAKQRAVLAEVLGQDRIGQAVILELIFRAGSQ
jgi:tetratricopeptide (TPR) repeat protein